MSNPVVIDPGSGSLKYGFAGDKVPLGSFREIVGIAKRHDTYSSVSNTVFIGEEAVAKRNMLTLYYPNENGIVTDWERMEDIIHSAFFDYLRTAPEEQPVFLTEVPLNPKANREKMCQLLFESFGVPSMFTANQPTLSLLASGRTTGVVIDSGEGVTQIVPIDEGYPIYKAIRRLDMGGRDISNYLYNLLSRRGHVFAGPTASLLSAFNTVNAMKEQLCLVADDFQNDLYSFENEPHRARNYQLPDGQVISLSSERIQAAEALFQPTLIQLNQDGLHKQTYQAITKCDMTIRKELYHNIVLSGGNTLLPSFANRLARELSALAPHETVIKIVEPAERKHAAWVGASMAAALPTVQSMFITKADYDEAGPSIVSRKGFW